MHQMFVNDLVDVILIHIGVPNAFGINRDHRPLGAAIHAAGVVHAAFSGAGKLKRFDFPLGVIAHGLRALGGAAGLAVLALIHTKKNVGFVVDSVWNSPRATAPFC